MPKKPDSADIISFIDQLSSTYKGTQQSFWPDYIFHYTDIQNAVSILKNDYLYSREKVNDKKLLIIDGASEAVLKHSQQTRQDYDKYVRFFFRPKHRHNISMKV